MNNNPFSFVQQTKVQLNTNNQDGITTVSIGVGQDAHFADNSTITDEYVSFISMNKLTL